MKTFKIYKNNAGVPGDYMDEYDAEQMDDSSANRSHLQASPNAVHLEVPVGADKNYSDPQLIPDTWSKEGEVDVTVDPADETWTKIDAHYALVEDLSSELVDKKPARLSAIDAKTAKLVSAGAVYDSETFSLSLNAQTNWAALKTLQALLTWPVSISTKDDKEYSLTEANLDAFAGTMMAVVQGHLDTGRALKVAINAATDMTELDAVVDNR